MARTNGNGDGAPETPAKLKPRSWAGVLKRTVSEFKEDKLTVVVTDYVKKRVPVQREQVKLEREPPGP